MVLGLAPLVAILLGAAQPGQPARGTHRRARVLPNGSHTNLYALSSLRYQPSRSWPLLLVFDPGGRAARAAEVFREAAERFGLDHRRLGELAERAMGAHPARRQRDVAGTAWRLLRGRTSRICRWPFGRRHGRVDDRPPDSQIAGVIVSGQPNPESHDNKGKPFAWFGMAGHADFNFMEVKKIDHLLSRTSSAASHGIFRRRTSVASRRA